MPLLENKADRLVYLAQLRAAAEAACKKARRYAVNWADLHCVSAEYRLDNQGDEYFSVLIEEASPDADELIVFLTQVLKDNGYTVEVETAW